MINYIFKYNGSSFHVQDETLEIKTDASSSGYEAFYVNSGKSISGLFEREVISKHINVKELLCIYYALLEFTKEVSDININIYIYNIVALSTINNLGTTADRELTE
uniref:RNase H domain-containing protein n=1 Tax=Strongyloides stercoralis TaxID=6248 RepID=A0A0K0DU31_STRER